MYLHLDFLNSIPVISCGTAIKCPSDPLPRLFSMLLNFVMINVKAQSISHPQLSTDTNSMHTDLTRVM